jgi:hypothetical protein
VENDTYSSSMTHSLDDLIKAGLPQTSLRPVTPHYLEEPRGRWHGQAAAIAAPGETNELAAIIRACAATRTPVVPFGGGTGLVGGQLAEDGAPPVILSLERMRAIRSFDAVAGTMTVEAGAILADIHAAAEAEDLIFPPHARLAGVRADRGASVHQCGRRERAALRQCARPLPRDRGGSARRLGDERAVGPAQEQHGV